MANYLIDLDNRRPDSGASALTEGDAAWPSLGALSVCWDRSCFGSRSVGFWLISEQW